MGGLCLMNIGGIPDLGGGVMSSLSFLAYGALVLTLGPKPVSNNASKANKKSEGVMKRAACSLPGKNAVVNVDHRL